MKGVNKQFLKALIKDYMELDRAVIWYFITFTFPPIVKGISEQEKISYMRSFFKKALRKNKFDYFWVVEKGEEQTQENLHVHAVINHNFTYSYITKWWNEILQVEENTPSTQTEPVSSVDRLINYLFKEKVEEYSISKGLSNHVKHHLTNATNRQINHLLTHDVWIKEVNVIKKATEQDQHELEYPMFERFEKVSPTIHEWVDKLILNMVSEKEEFMCSIGRTLPKNPAYVYIQKVKDRDSGLSLLFKGLVFFYALMAMHGGRQNEYLFFQRLYNVLVNLLDNGRLFCALHGGDVGEIGSAYHMALHFHTLVKAILPLYFDVVSEWDRETQTSFIRVKFMKKYTNLPLQNLFLKGFAPMLVPPIDWKLKVVDEGKAPTPIEEIQPAVGGYLNNGINFFLPICKKHIGNSFDYLKQEGVDAINHLQQTPLAINTNLLSFISENKKYILAQLYNIPDEGYKKNLPEMILQAKNHWNDTLKSKEAYVHPLVAQVKQQALAQGLKGSKVTHMIKQIFAQDTKLKEMEEGVRKLHKHYIYLTTQLQQVDKFESLLDTALYYNDYECFYLVYQIDFRGRIYVRSDILNYQADKLARNLIYFKRKVKMNLYWFKIYCVRKFGITLQVNSAAQMVVYFDTTLSHTMNSFRINNCWAQADDPWGFLNCCLEYERYMQLGNNCYISGMPIYFDATCSGSQLISLLFKEEKYAKELNLTSSDENQPIGDFYMSFINQFRGYLSENYPQHKLIEQKLNKPELWRKMFKHVIMTLSYGLTKPGVLQKLLQVNSELSEEHKLPFAHLSVLQNGFWKFIDTQKLFSCLDLIQQLTDQLAKLNKHIEIYSNEHGFTTSRKDASRLYTQGYRVYMVSILSCDTTRTKKFIKKNPHHRNRVHSQLTVYTPNYESIDKDKQQIAILPNLIHHLDAIWMHGVIQRFKANNGGLFVIHDCFGVLMSDPHMLNIHVRETLYNFFKTRDNIYELLLQLQAPASDVKNDVGHISIPTHKDLDNILGKLDINLKDAFYLIFPG